MYVKKNHRVSLVVVRPASCLIFLFSFGVQATPSIDCQTNSHRIQISKEDGTLSYRSWKTGRGIEEKPDLQLGPGSQSHPGEWGLPFQTNKDSQGYFRFDLGRSKDKPPKNITLLAPNRTQAAIYQGKEKYCQSFCADTSEVCGSYAKYKPLRPIENVGLALVGSHPYLQFEGAGDIKFKTLTHPKLLNDNVPKFLLKYLELTDFEKKCSIAAYEQFTVIQCAKSLAILLDRDHKKIYESSADYGEGLIRPIGKLTSEKQKAFVFEIGIKGRNVFAIFYDDAKSQKWQVRYYKINFHLHAKG